MTPGGGIIGIGEKLKICHMARGHQDPMHPLTEGEILHVRAFLVLGLCSSPYWPNEEESLSIVIVSCLRPVKMW